MEHEPALRDAAASYRGSSFDLHDRLLSAVAAQRRGRVLSFDSDLRRLGTGENP